MGDYERFQKEAVKLITWAQRNFPDGMTVVPPTIRDAKREKVTARTQDGKTRVRPATITIEVPDLLVAKLKNDEDFRDLIYIVHVRGELLERYASKVLLPGEVRN